jgi:cytochrome c551/c552
MRSEIERINMNIDNRIFNTLILLILFIAFFAQSSESRAQGEAPQASGEELFIQYRCVRCHTIGRGKFVGPDLKGVGDRYARTEVLRWIENPQLIYSSSGKMPINPGFPPMPPMQVPPQAAQSIADYILSAKPGSDASSGGTVAGKVVNGSDEAARSGVEVTITPFMGDVAGTGQTIASDAEGAFSFDELPWDRSYAISVNYKGAEYTTDKMVFNPGEDRKTLNLPVYEPSLSDENIRIEEAHLIVQVLDGDVTVADLNVFNNTGDTIYIGGKELSEGRKESLRYSLPEGAFNLNFIHGLDTESVVTTEGGFSDTTSILPGPKRAVFSYNVPLKSGNAIIEKSILYPTSSFLLLILETENKFVVEGLSEEEPVVINNEKFLKWTGLDLPAGSEVVIEIKSGLAGRGDYVKWAALTVLAVIVLSGVAYSLVRKPKEEGGVSDEAAGEVEGSNLLEKRGALIREIAALDDRYETGDVGKVEYKDLRDKKKNELLEITRRLRATRKSP